MALRRRDGARRSAGDAPAELLDRDHPVWQSVQTTDDWCVAHRLPIDVPPWGPSSRFLAAATAWALANDLTQTTGSNNPLPRPDAGALLARGIPFYGTAQTTLELLASHGVRVDA